MLIAIRSPQCQVSVTARSMLPVRRLYVTDDGDISGVITPTRSSGPITRSSVSMIGFRA